MINFLLYFFVFVFGLVAGSFLNCVTYRLERKQSALKGRSYCPYCKHQLSWYDLIPVLSFIILKGKCRYCQKPISIQYPLVEIATASLFLLIFNFPPHQIFDGGFNFQNFVSFCFVLCVSSFLIVIFVYDLKHYIIPDKVIFPTIGVVFLYQLFEVLKIENFQSLLYFLAIAFLASAFFLAIVLATKGRGMGLGDVKLAFLMGLLLGWPNIFVAFFLAFLIGAIIGIGLILARKKTLKSEVPFGPFLVVGTFIALFWGQELINFYLNLFI
ncbi:prepilin peptidase [Candidatus Parcubacteria bacterium]|nr:prepilin peptidase [Candidatus Parcubacteria bacterium]